MQSPMSIPPERNVLAARKLLSPYKMPNFVTLVLFMNSYKIVINKGPCVY